MTIGKHKSRLNQATLSSNAETSITKGMKEGKAGKNNVDSSCPMLQWSNSNAPNPEAKGEQTPPLVSIVFEILSKLMGYIQLDKRKTTTEQQESWPYRSIVLSQSTELVKSSEALFTRKHEKQLKIL